VNKILIDVSITGKASEDNMEWVSSTRHSNLSDEKLPVYFRRLKSLCMPFMQIILCELPRGGQLSIHSNVVNVPADVNSVVDTLPKPINESQTILIKLKSKLS